MGATISTENIKEVQKRTGRGVLDAGPGLQADFPPDTFFRHIS
jgi:hypothetical protein